MNDRPQVPNPQYAQRQPAEGLLAADDGGETALPYEMIQSPYSRPGDHAFIRDGAEQLLQIFRTGFEREWVLEQLKSVPSVIVANAETELHVLDLFAVYFAIRRHPAQIWQQHGAALYEQFLAQVLTWWCTEANRSMVPLLENRFAIYNRLLSEITYATLDDMVSGVAIMTAMMLPDNSAEYSGSEHHDADGLARFVSALNALMEDGNPLTVTAARVFRRSYDAISQLLSEIASDVTDLEAPILRTP